MEANGLEGQIVKEIIMLLKLFIAGAVAFYMFLFWLARPKRIEVPCCRRISPTMSCTNDELDREVKIDNNIH